MIEYGYCHCGCGEKTGIAVRTDPRFGYVKGEPARFKVGHALRDPEIKARMSAKRKEQGNFRTGSVLSNETKAKIAKAHQGQIRPNISKALMGRKVSQETKHRISEALKGRYEPGRRVKSPEDGNKRQAHMRVKTLVGLGIIPAPKTVPCTDCGQVWEEGLSRHEYDHYLGYDGTHHDDVQVVCSKCHHAREKSRGRVHGGFPKPCSIEGCRSIAKSRGWCSTHHARWLRHGDAQYIGPRTKKP